MNLVQVKGNTWAALGAEYIPLYILEDGKRCVLLDSGLPEEQQDLERALLSAGLTPAGVLCSHAHVDHSSNNGYFREKYGARLALTFPEWGMCSSLLTLKCYFLLLPPGMVEREAGSLVQSPDIILPPEDGPFPFCGALFQILHTPGHSAGHICTITPDRVCYTADALLSREMLDSKLPYALSHAAAAKSREKLRNLDCEFFLLAHRGCCSREEFPALVDDNHALIRRRMDEILSLVASPMTAGEITQAVCEFYSILTRKPRRSLRFERNVRFFLEFLTDAGYLEMKCRQGITCYRRTGKPGTPQLC